jgi:hypothetical protein
MGWLDKIFGNKDSVPARTSSHAPLTSEQFADDEEESESSGGDSGSRRSPRRDVLGVVLRDTMRRHGIPSDWIEARILSVRSATRGEGMHVLLVVRQGDDRLATYVHAFQRAFMEDLLKLEPKAREWVFSVSWQFEGNDEPAHSTMPDPASWSARTQSSVIRKPAEAAPAAAPASGSEDSQLEEDLQALFRIRDQAMGQAGAPVRDGPDFEPTRPGGEDGAQQGRDR